MLYLIALKADFQEVWNTCKHIFSDINLKNYWDEIKANFKEKSMVKSIMKQMKEDLHSVNERFHQCLKSIESKADKWGHFLESRILLPIRHNI